ncbi:hypothetical protein [Caudoviricetes sp.]|nr:hypothetical protein [Caudoviricetes sp.]
MSLILCVMLSHLLMDTSTMALLLKVIPFPLLAIVICLIKLQQIHLLIATVYLSKLVV